MLKCGCRERAVIRRGLAGQFVDFLIFLASIDGKVDVERRGELASSDRQFELSALFSHTTARDSAPTLKSCHSPLGSQGCLMAPSWSHQSSSGSHKSAAPVRTMCTTQSAPSSQMKSDCEDVRHPLRSAPKPVSSSSTLIEDEKTSDLQGESRDSITDGELGCQMAKGAEKGRFVLCMPGSFPIQHIDVGNVRTDDELFDKLCSLYRSRLSMFKWLLSINRFHHYGFDKVRLRTYSPASDPKLVGVGEP